MKTLFPIFFLLLANLIFFYQSVILHKVPLPADIPTGVYYPWLDYKWPGYPAGVPVKNPLLSDVTSLFYPLKIYALSSIRQGHWSLWNPLLFAGYPLVGNIQLGLFNFTNFLFLIFSASSAWTIYIFLQPFFAAVFMYFFLRDLALDKFSALFGSIAFAYSGFSLIWLEYGIHGYVLATIPALFLLAGRFLRTLNIKYALFFSVFLAWQVFSGYPQLTLYTLIFLSLWLFCAIKAPLKTLLVFFTFVVLGILIASVQLIPGAELVSLSQRVGETVSGGSEVAFLQWSQFLSPIAPDFFGHPSTYNYWGPGDYTNNSGYVGVVVLVMVLLGLPRLSSGFVKFSAIAAIASYLLAFPSPVSSLLYSLPLFSAATATRILAFFTFFAALLAAHGFSRLKFHLSFNRYFPSLFVLLLLAMSFFGVLVAHFYLKSPVLMVTLRNLIPPLTISFLVFLILFNFKYRRLLLVLIMTAELFRFGWKYNPFVPAGLIFPPTPLTDYLQSRPKSYRVLGGDVWPPNLWLAYGLSSVNGYDAAYPALIARLLSVADGVPIEYPKGRIGDLNRYDSPLLNLMSIRYLLALNRDPNRRLDPAGSPSAEFIQPQLRPVFKDKTVTVLENSKALPKYSLIPSALVLSNEHEVMSHLLSTSFDPSRQLVISSSSENFPSTIPSDFLGSIKEISESPDKIKILYDSSHPAFILATQTFFPGWQATVDNIPHKIYRADYAFQTVFVPKGEHTVTFTYSPTSYKIGTWLTLSALILIPVIYVISNRRQATSKRPSGLV